MTSLLVSGPAGAGKTAAARLELNRRAAPTVLVDFQSIYATLLGLERLPNGRYPERLESQAYALATTEYVRRATITAARERQIDVIATNSDGSVVRRRQLLSLLGPGASERVIDPGRDVVKSTASGQTGVCLGNAKRR